MQVLPLQIMALQNGNPLAVQQLKKMQPSTATPQMRISSGVGMCLSTMQQLQQQPTQPQMPHASQPPQGQMNTTPVQSHSPCHSALPVSHISPLNTTATAATHPGITIPHIEVPKPKVASSPLTNSIPTSILATYADTTGEGGTNGMPVRPKLQNLTPQQHFMDGYHLTCTSSSEFGCISTCPEWSDGWAIITASSDTEVSIC